jgi:hypothetical protein
VVYADEPKLLSEACKQYPEMLEPRYTAKLDDVEEGEEQLEDYGGEDDA